MRRGLALAVVPVALAVVLAFFVLRRTRPPPPPRPAARIPTFTPAPAQSPTYLALYHGLSGKLPAAAPAPPEPTTKIASAGKSPELLTWVPSLRVDRSGTTIFASLRDAAGAAVTPDAIEVALADSGPPVTHAMAPAAGEATHQWAFRAPEKLPPAGDRRQTAAPRQYHFVVRARGTLGGAPYERSAGGVFFLHQPGARIESTSLSRRDGNLALELAIAVERAGNYWAYAELWAASDRPIAFARQRFENLAPGRQPLGLLFGGKIIRDAAIDGPYTVRNVHLKQVDTHPAQEAAPIAALPPTPPWPAADFR